MKRFVGYFGTLLGLVWMAYGLLMMTGVPPEAVPCRADCQMNSALRLLFGEVAAHRIIGGAWVVSGAAFFLFVTARRHLRSKGVGRRQKARGRESE